MKLFDGSIRVVDKIINFIIWTIILVVLFFSGYALFDAHETYEKAKLSPELLKYRPSENEIFSLTDIQKEINEDICGWIRINGTNIDYPIVIGEDNSEYRNYDYRKEYSITGSIFMDYRNDRSFNDDYTVIYGHNLKKDLMFAEIKNFADKKYFDEHQYGLVYSENVIYKLEIVYFENLNAYSKPYSLMFYNNGYNEQLLEEFDKNAINKSSSIDISSDDKIVLLSTCNSSDTEIRSVLIGKLVEVDESEIINKKEDITLNEIDKQLSDREKYENIDKVVKDGDTKKKDTIFICINLVLVICLVSGLMIVFIIKIKSKNPKKPKKKGKHMK